MPTKDELEKTLVDLRAQVKQLMERINFLEDQSKWLKKHAEEAGTNEAKIKHEYLRLKEQVGD